MDVHFTENMSQFLNAYITCALWSTSDDSGKPFDQDFSKEDLDADCLMLMTVDCYNFYRENFSNNQFSVLSEDYTCSQAGHDFWLNRNGHGAGYWDRGLGRAGDILSKRAGACGEVYLFIENNKVHYS